MSKLSLKLCRNEQLIINMLLYRYHQDAVVLLPVHGWVFEKEPMFPFNYVGVLFAIGFGRFVSVPVLGQRL